MEKNKTEIIAQIAALLSQLIDDNDNQQKSSAAKNTERLNTYLLNLLAENCGKSYETLKEDCRNDYFIENLYY